MMLDWAHSPMPPHPLTHVLWHCSAHDLDVAIPKFTSLIRADLRDMLIELGHKATEASQFVYASPALGTHARIASAYAETLLRLYRRDNGLVDPRLIGSFDRVVSPAALVTLMGKGYSSGKESAL
jgi:hypothetical protein